jgi:hypothetical protein
MLWFAFGFLLGAPVGIITYWWIMRRIIRKHMTAALEAMGSASDNTKQFQDLLNQLSTPRQEEVR